MVYVCYIFDDNKDWPRRAVAVFDDQIHADNYCKESANALAMGGTVTESMFGETWSVTQPDRTRLEIGYHRQEFGEFPFTA